MEGQQHPPPIDASKLEQEPPRAMPSSPPPSSASPSGASPSGASASGVSASGAAPSADADVTFPEAFAERPELYVGAAFAGGVVLAGLLRILSR